MRPLAKTDLRLELQTAVDRVLDAHAAGTGRVRIIADPGAGSILVVRCAAAMLDGSTPRARVGREIARTLGRYDVPAPGTVADATAPAPFRAPHHTVSRAGMFGGIGGNRVPHPGEISLAHGGTLLLDEWAQFPRIIREEIPRVLGAGRVEFHRAGGFFAYPADPAMVIAIVRPGETTPLPGAVDVEIGPA